MQATLIVLSNGKIVNKAGNLPEEVQLGRYLQSVKPALEREGWVFKKRKGRVLTYTKEDKPAAVAAY